MKNSFYMYKNRRLLKFPHRACCCRETSALQMTCPLYTWTKRRISTRVSFRGVACWIKEKFCIDFKALAKEHGPYLLVFYFFFNQFCLLTLTALFHLGYLSTAAVKTILGYVGLDRFLPDENAKHDNNGTSHDDRGSFWATIAMEYAFSSVIVSILTPIQIPLCISLWPRLCNLLKRIRK